MLRGALPESYGSINAATAAPQTTVHSWVAHAPWADASAAAGDVRNDASCLPPFRQVVCSFVLGLPVFSLEGSGVCVFSIIMPRQQSNTLKIQAIDSSQAAMRSVLLRAWQATSAGRSVLVLTYYKLLQLRLSSMLVGEMPLLRVRTLRQAKCLEASVAFLLLWRRHAPEQAPRGQLHDRGGTEAFCVMVLFCGTEV